MAALTPEFEEMFRAAKQYPLATASEAGDPNVVPVTSVFLIDPRTIWVGDQFMNATIVNLRENPRACLYALGPDAKGCLKIKADVDVLGSGPDYEKMKEMVKERRADLVRRALPVLRIAVVYSCRPGPEAGKRLL